MIPLNKPGYLHSYPSTDYLGTHFTGYQHTILSNAGDGLNLIYKYLYEQQGALKVGVSPLSCFQAIYPIIANGHTPVFIDIDEDTFNINANELTRTDGLDAVELIHLGGNPNEMDAICSWANLHNITVIEDCAQALGSSYHGKETGTFGDYATFSLIKNLNAYAGGLLLSKKDLPTAHLSEMSNAVLTYKRLKKYLESHSDHRPYNLWNLPYLLLLKTKERGTKDSINSQACRLSPQEEEKLCQSLAAIDNLNKKRKEIASYIIDNLDKRKYMVQKEPEGGQTNRNRLMLRLNEHKAEPVIAKLRKASIAANNLTQNYLCGFQPHVSKDKWLNPYYHADKLKCYDAIFNHIIAIPCSPFLTPKETDYIIHQLNHI